MILKNKKNIIKRYFNLCLYTIVLAVSTNLLISLASTYKEYTYSKILSEFGMKTDPLKSSEDIEKIDNYRSTGLVTSSNITNLNSIQRNYINHHQYVLVVCDSDYSINYNIGCNYFDSYDYENGTYITPISPTGPKITLTNLNNISYILVPEILLVNPKYTLKAVKSFEIINKTIKNNEYSFHNYFSDKISNEFDYTVINNELLFILICSFVLIAIISYTYYLKTLIKDTNYISYLKKYFDHLHYFCLLIFPFLLTSYFFVYVFLSLKKFNSVFGAGILDMLINTLDLRYVAQNSSRQDFINIILFIFNYIMIGSIIVFLVKTLYNFYLSRKIYVFKSLDNLNNNNIPIYLILIGIYFTIIYGLRDPSFVLFFTFSGIFISLYSGRTYSKKEKLLFILLLILVIPIKFIYSIIVNNTHEYISLVQKDSNFLSSNITENIKNNNLISPVYVKPSNDIFINDYLIYSTKFSTIINKDISKFEDKDNYYILNSSMDILSKFILKNSDFMKILISSEPSNTIYLHKPLQNVYIEISRDCLNSYKSVDINLFIYNLDLAEESRFASLPQCNYDQISQTFYIPIEMKYLSKDSILLFDANIKDVKLKYSIFNMQNRSSDSTIYLDYKTTRRVLFSRLTTEYSSTIVSYSLSSLDTDDEIKFTNTLKDPINISENINYLISNKFVSKVINLWTYPNEIGVMQVSN